MGDHITTMKQFVKEYPDEIMWFPIIGIRCEDTKYLRINNLTVNFQGKNKMDFAKLIASSTKSILV